MERAFIKAMGVQAHPYYKCRPGNQQMVWYNDIVSNKCLWKRNKEAELIS